MKRFIKNTICNIIDLLPSSAVLMLHNITETPIVKKKILLSEERFFELIDSFNNWISIEMAVNKPFKKGVVLTFDDGFEDIYTVAYPYLKSKNVPFTVFLTFEKLNEKGYLTTEQLLELSKDKLCTIGAHCYHHLPLAKLSMEEQKFEILSSKSEIEKIIEKKVEYMAYPYGQYNRTTLKILKESKAYKASFIVGRGFLNCISGFSKYEQPRIGIDNEVFEKNLMMLKKKYNAL